jgi:hypothetical protein
LGASLEYFDGRGLVLCTVQRIELFIILFKIPSGRDKRGCGIPSNAFKGRDQVSLIAEADTNAVWGYKGMVLCK